MRRVICEVRCEFKGNTDVSWFRRHLQRILEQISRFHIGVYRSVLELYSR